MRPVLLLLALAAWGCDSATETRPAAAVYVGNGDGSVTRLDVATGASSEAFRLDAPLQDLVERGRRLYALAADAEADSGRVVEIDLETGARVRETAVLAPRRLAIAEGIGFVTNGRTFSVTPVRLATGEAEPTFIVGDGPRGVAVVDGRVYVASWNRGRARDVRVASALTRALRNQDDDVIADVCDGPRDVIGDRQGRAWVVCTGRLATAEAPPTTGAVVVIDNQRVVARFDLEATLESVGGRNAAFRAATDELVVAVGATLVRFDTRATERLGAVGIGGEPAPVSAVAVDEASGEVYLGRLGAAPQAPGFVSVHQADGTEVRRFAAGAVPTAIVFERR